MEQTAVEWLVDKLNKQGLVTDEEINQAKKMEKQQKCYSEEDLKAAYNAESEGWSGFDFWFEQFKNK